MEPEFSNMLTHPSLDFVIITIIVVFLLVRWSKQLETRRFTIFFYFLISTFITPMHTYYTEERIFQLWFPLGFAIVLLYSFFNPKIHPNKMKASFLGIIIGLYNFFFYTLNIF